MFYTMSSKHHWKGQTKRLHTGQPQPFFHHHKPWPPMLTLLLVVVVVDNGGGDGGVHAADQAVQHLLLASHLRASDGSTDPAPIPQQLHGVPGAALTVSAGDWVLASFQPPWQVPCVPWDPCAGGSKCLESQAAHLPAACGLLQGGLVVDGGPDAARILALVACMEVRP